MRLIQNMVDANESRNTSEEGTNVPSMEQAHPHQGSSYQDLHQLRKKRPRDLSP